MSRQLRLNLFVHSRGHHEASWRHPEASPLALTDFEFHRELARKAEDAAFDSIFLADSLSMSGEVTHTARSWLEPVTLLGALAAATSKIGLIATASTTYTEPFNAPVRLAGPHQQRPDRLEHRDLLVGRRGA